MKRYDIPVLNKESIPEILNYFKISVVGNNLDDSRYNPYNQNYFQYQIKNPPDGLLAVYLRARDNKYITIFSYKY
ncbi:hypothetical protein SLY_1030 [Strawberry lethal yellows phytoplasma (CPA) str. NZSb11]|uniref:Uncharacterized protein n=1 Tax=Strawberry lethal yellows phytoplasma (CPA) str. NZSb11 TaxID=980422 RepID=R4S2B2_PHYAS|nr:hypothetical protein SLY_1030 [Strawberry lethal yellows phytoplasma (CPA) str. NZSb11]